jgi:hypothetical protein
MILSRTMVIVTTMVNNLKRVCEIEEERRLFHDYPIHQPHCPTSSSSSSSSSLHFIVHHHLLPTLTLFPTCNTTTNTTTIKKVGLHWLLGVPGVLGAACASAGWQLLVISLLPLLVCEATPNHSRCRALAVLTATSVIYAPVTLVGFDTAKDNAGALGPALLM